LAVAFGSATAAFLGFLMPISARFGDRGNGDSASEELVSVPENFVDAHVAVFKRVSSSSAAWGGLVRCGGDDESDLLR
jgi:hypothetical protein